MNKIRTKISTPDMGVKGTVCVRCGKLWDCGAVSRVLSDDPCRDWPDLFEPVPDEPHTPKCRCFNCKHRYKPLTEYPCATCDDHKRNNWDIGEPVPVVPPAPQYERVEIRYDPEGYPMAGDRTIDHRSVIGYEFAEFPSMMFGYERGFKTGQRIILVAGIGDIMDGKVAPVRARWAHVRKEA